MNRPGLNPPSAVPQPSPISRRPPCRPCMTSWQP